MATAIDNFLMEIEEDLKNFRNGDAVRSTGRAENFLLDHADEIKKESEEIFDLAFDVQTEFAELESGADNRKRLAEIRRLYKEIKSIQESIED
ncbi:MAG: hypothetical protein E7D08_03235 [Peptoniphilus harei]|nr:hypothetical protein [Peptoniphilus harei]